MMTDFQFLAELSLLGECDLQIDGRPIWIFQCFLLNYYIKALNPENGLWSFRNSDILCYLIRFTKIFTALFIQKCFDKVKMVKKQVGFD